MLRRHQWYDAATQDTRLTKIASERAADKENGRQRVRFKVMWSILLVAEFSEEKSDEFEESE